MSDDARDEIEWAPVEALLAKVPPIEAPVGFVADVMAALPTELPVPVPKFDWGFAVAGALAAAACGFAMVRVGVGSSGLLATRGWLMEAIMPAVSGVDWPRLISAGMWAGLGGAVAIAVQSVGDLRSAVAAPAITPLAAPHGGGKADF